MDELLQLTLYGFHCLPMSYVLGCFEWCLRTVFIMHGGNVMISLSGKLQLVSYHQGSILILNKYLLFFKEFNTEWLDHAAPSQAMHLISKISDHRTHPFKSQLVPCVFTHCDTVTPYGDIDLGQHWLRQWLVAWGYQAITRTNVDLSVWSSDVRQKTIS